MKKRVLSIILAGVLATSMLAGCGAKSSTDEGSKPAASGEDGTTLMSEMGKSGAPTLAAFIIGFIVPFVQGLYLSFCQFTTAFLNYQVFN